MEAVQKDYWYFLVLLICLLFPKDAVAVKAPSTTVKLEEGMILDCVCPWSGNLSMVSWIKRPGSSPMAIYHPEFGMNFSPDYDGRVEFIKASPMDGSISITNVTEKDLGLYHCSMQTFPHGSWTKDTVVENIVNIFTIKPDSVVLVEESGNFTIKCNHVHNGTVYSVTIEKLVEGSSSIVAVCRAKDGDVSSEENYAERVWVNCSDAMDVSLHLTDATQDDQGLYQCHFRTDLGTQTTAVLVTTVSAQDLRNHPMLYIYIGGAVSGIVVILTVTWILIFLYRKKKREECKIKLHPRRQPNNTYVQGTVYDRMKKGPRLHRRDSPVYGNIPNPRFHKKGKR
ncbi:CD226 antigen [Chanos chanos]|uniref:CD226 antigen n=1 Tax=Chanos chanos TaxID=29144 RepID=A0A6J2USH8_CHACN|nr:CD226 antigen [Chanos chanos]